MKDRPRQIGVVASRSNGWPSWVLGQRDLDGQLQPGQRDPSRGDLGSLKQLHQGTGRLVLSLRASYRPHCDAELTSEGQGQCAAFAALLPSRLPLRAAQTSPNRSVTRGSFAAADGHLHAKHESKREATADDVVEQALMQRFRTLARHRSSEP